MAILIKFIALPLYPLGFAIVLQIIGLIFLGKKKNRLAGTFLCTGFLILLIFSSPVIAQMLGRSLEKKYVQKLPPPDSCSAIVVLGGGGVPLIPPRSYPEINEAGDRLIHAARLYKMGIAHKVITTGGDVGTALFDAPSEGVENALLLRDIGVDSSSICIDPKARNTHEHPLYIAKILDSLHLKRSIILVTSASHMPRAIAVFKKFGGYTIFPAPADFSTTGKIFNNITDFFPKSSALDRSTVIIHEYYGIIGYKLLGWI